MTAVVLIKSEKSFTMISDLMLTSSSKADSEAEAFAPTIHKEDKSKAGDKFVFGLFQKVILINENVTVGYATRNMSDAIFFIKYLNRRLGSSTKDFNQIESVIAHFGKYYPNRLTNLQYILVHTFCRADNFTEIKIWNRGAVKGTLGPFSNVYYIGTGGSYLINQISLMTDAVIKQPPIIFGDDTDDLDPVMMIPLAIISQTTVSQYFSGYGLDKQWGGGFEVCVLIDGKIES